MEIFNIDKNEEISDLVLDNNEIRLLKDVLDFQITRYEKLINELYDDEDEKDELENVKELKQLIEKKGTNIVNFTIGEAVRFRTAINAYDSDEINNSAMQKIRKMQYEFDDMIGQMDKYL
ncbi:MAG: hypothetical protein ACPKPY_10865 [Nitrososphaeraceae archaeon]